MFLGRDLLCQDIVDNLLSSHHSGFSVHGDVNFHDQNAAARLTWATLIKKLYEIDPLLCPLCRSQMKIVAFITEYPTVRHILKYIHMPPQRPEPLAHPRPASGRAVRLGIYRTAAPPQPACAHASPSPGNGTFFAQRRDS